jgi:hypothetical protein
MKIIKLILAVASFFVFTLTFAQPDGGGQGGQQGSPPIPNDEQIVEMVYDLANEMALATDQETKILELYKAHFAKV